MVLWCCFADLWATEPASTGVVIAKFEDILPVLPPLGASKWDPAPLVAGISASTFSFTPNHYYTLLDKGNVHPDVLKIVAAKGGVFYDPNAKPLSVIAQTARNSASKSTIALGAANFVELFEFFNDAKNDLASAEASAGPDTPQGPNETVSLYERRVRTRTEKLANSKGPIEGRIDQTTFAIDLPASVVEQGGCSRSLAVADMSDISFDLFRSAMGTVAATANVSLANSPNIDSAKFTIDGGRRFEVLGRCGTTATKLRMSASRTWDGKWSGSGSF